VKFELYQIKMKGEITMKKMLILVLTGIMLLGLTATTLAASDPSGGKAAKVDKADSQIKVKDLQGYDQLLQLREEGKATRDEIKADKQQLKDLIKAAKDTKNADALPIIKQYRSELQGLRDELKSLRTTQQGNWEAMKTARQAGDQSQMQAIMDQILNTRQALNAQLVNVKTSVEEFIQALQGI
jgi:hypothetical protein